MIFTIIGIVTRCVFCRAFADFRFDYPMLFKVALALYIILCGIGVFQTFAERYKCSALGAFFKMVFQIAISVYFISGAYSIVGTIISGIVSLIVAFLIMGAMPSSPTMSDEERQRLSDNVDSYFDDNLQKVREQSRLEEEKRANEQVERENYVRSNWNSSIGNLNSDATYYQTSDGEWNKISKDGRRYEDSYGNWHSL